MAGALERYRPTFAFFPPTLARVLSPESLEILDTLLVGGEPLIVANHHNAYGKCDVISVYGPSECTVVAASLVVNPNQTFDHAIGTGLGSNLWVVAENNLLAPVGGIGELYIEGPLVTRGYYKDPDKTLTAFVQDPSWLRRGCSDHAGRSGLVYKTGDLVRQNVDGSLTYVSRKDQQVKLRGQRIELSEVEHHVKQSLLELGVDPGTIKYQLQARDIIVVAELLEAPDSPQKFLCAFIHLRSFRQNDEEMHRRAVRNATVALEQRLISQLPGYLVPTCFAPLWDVPTTVTGKIDRRRLRQVGVTVAHTELTRSTTEPQKRMPTTEAELAIQQLWSKILNIGPTIGVDDDFYRVGGGTKLLVLGRLNVC